MWPPHSVLTFTQLIEECPEREPFTNPAEVINLIEKISKIQAGVTAPGAAKGGPAPVPHSPLPGDAHSPPKEPMPSPRPSPRKEAARTSMEGVVASVPGAGDPSVRTVSPGLRGLSYFACTG